MLSYFQDFEHQEAADLDYGKQLDSCQSGRLDFAGYSDRSISGDWTPEDD